MDLTEAEDIKKRWQEYTEKLYKNHHDQDNLEKASLRKKLVEVMEFQSSYFKS